MPRIHIKSVKEGDVLARDVVIGGVVLFEAGTVLAGKHIDVLTVLKVETVFIEPRSLRKLNSLHEIYRNIDKRFNYVEDNSFMMSLKYLVKDVVSNVKAKR